jgi:hypothetical protein
VIAASRRRSAASAAERVGGMSPYHIDNKEYIQVKRGGWVIDPLGR